MSTEILAARTEVSLKFVPIHKRNARHQYFCGAPEMHAYFKEWQSAWWTFVAYRYPCMSATGGTLKRKLKQKTMRHNEVRWHQWHRSPTVKSLKSFSSNRKIIANYRKLFTMTKKTFLCNFSLKWSKEILFFPWYMLQLFLDQKLRFSDLPLEIWWIRTKFC